ncbi:collagen alpha-1(I) chain-like [Motacilla alba alba]|uniref:collagen alpha-1(I) chain-like n=1 Tax=Motacilla alba alba TaxID=1094192 RepID=UPI0018D5236D|nr:collagen alpha-1(I) chain-like [Motacilla alba alba]XP_037997109.1 collagen alpha-1(I) chain-like [Motacilla alba alba]
MAPTRTPVPRPALRRCLQDGPGQDGPGSARCRSAGGCACQLWALGRGTAPGIGGGCRQSREPQGMSIRIGHPLRQQPLPGQSPNSLKQSAASGTRSAPVPGSSAAVARPSSRVAMRDAGPRCRCRLGDGERAAGGLSRARCGPSGPRSPGDRAAAAPSAGEGPGAAGQPAPTCGHPPRRGRGVPGLRAAARLRHRGINLAARVASTGDPPAALGEAGGSGTSGPGGRIGATPSARAARCAGRAARPWEPSPASPGVRAELLARPDRPSQGPRGGGSGPGEPGAVPELGALGGAPQTGEALGLGLVKPAESSVSGGNLQSPCLSALETPQDKRGSHPCQSRLARAGAAAVRSRCANAWGRMKHTSGSARGEQGAHELGSAVKPSRQSGDGSRAQAAPGKRLPSAAQADPEQQRVPGAAGSGRWNKKEDPGKRAVQFQLCKALASRHRKKAI